MELGKRIRERRLGNQLTQQALAKRAGISQPSLSSIESDQKRPSLDTAMRLAAALGCKLDDLVENGKDGQPWGRAAER